MSKRTLPSRPSLFLMLVVAVVSVSACGVPATPEPSPTVAPTATASGAVVTASLMTASPPTFTPAPPTLTPTAIASPTETATEEPTPDYAATTAALIPKVVALSPSKHVSSYPSPDGRWQAQFTTYDCVKVEDDSSSNSYDELSLVRTDTGESQVIDFELQYCEGLGAYGLGALFWSANSRYFYYTTAAHGVPDGGCGYWARPWVSVEAATGQKENLTEGPLAPDGKRMAFASWSEDEVVLWSLNEGRAASLKAFVPQIMVGPLAWSPDGQALVYLQWSDYCFPGKSYVVRVDWSGPTQSLLLESGEPAFVGVRWDAPNRLRLSDAEGGQWNYDLLAQRLSRAP